MYENVHDILLKKKLIKIIEENDAPQEQILKVLFEELEKPKLSPSETVLFCSCQYPIRFVKKGEVSWLEPLLKTEVDFDHYMEYFYCPNCEKLLEEIQH